MSRLSSAGRWRGVSMAGRSRYRGTQHGRSAQWPAKPVAGVLGRRRADRGPRGHHRDDPERNGRDRHHFQQAAQPTGRRRQCPRRQARVLADLPEAGAERLLGLLGRARRACIHGAVSTVPRRPRTRTGTAGGQHSGLPQPCRIRNDRYDTIKNVALTRLSVWQSGATPCEAGGCPAGGTPARQADLFMEAAVVARPVLQVALTCCAGILADPTDIISSIGSSFWVINGEDSGSREDLGDHSAKVSP